jgi:hypothetical protein
MRTWPRSVEPELLDDLPAADPRALRARRDLQRVNAWMRQATIMAGLLRRHASPPPRVLVDLGAGDGVFMLRVARRLAPQWPQVNVILLDRQISVNNETLDGFARIGWSAETVARDANAFLSDSSMRADAVTANLFLHHFPPPALNELLVGAARFAPLFVACEPRRSQLALLGSRLLWAIGCGPVARYDAVVSVHAGFADHELAAAWPQESGWQLHEFGALPFTHCFVACRETSP